MTAAVCSWDVARRGSPDRSSPWSGTPFSTGGDVELSMGRCWKFRGTKRLVYVQEHAVKCGEV